MFENVFNGKMLLMMEQTIPNLKVDLMMKGSFPLRGLTNPYEILMHNKYENSFNYPDKVEQTNRYMIF